MSAIKEFAARQTEFHDRVDTAINGLQDDVKQLNSLIANLQTTTGAITVEDQGLLDKVEARGAAILGKLTALDNLTPPALAPNVA